MKLHVKFSIQMFLMLVKEKDSHRTGILVKQSCTYTGMYKYNTWNLFSNHYKGAWHSCSSNKRSITVWVLSLLFVKVQSNTHGTGMQKKDIKQNIIQNNVGMVKKRKEIRYIEMRQAYE